MIYLSLEQTSKSEQHMYGVFSLNSYEFCRAKLQKLGVLAYNQVKKRKGQSKEIKQKWTKPRNFDIYFCVIFICNDQNLNFWEED